MPKRSHPVRFDNIPLDRIDPPPLAIRQTMDLDKLDELKDSIERMGLLEPLILKPIGNRYQILAGHRRYLACVRAHLATAPALIRSAEEKDGRAITMHENWCREDVNPADEAVFLNEVLNSECGGDIDKLTDLTKLRRGYVEDRLALLDGDTEVLELLQRHKINLGVAKELNKFKDHGYRRMYADAAARGGATAGMVREWRVKSEVLAPNPDIELNPDPPPGGGAPPPTPFMVCVCCGTNENVYDMELLYVHRGLCKRMLNRFAQLATAPPSSEAS